MAKPRNTAAYIAAIHKGSIPAPTAGLPRPAGTFTDGGFGPNRPTTASPIDVNRPGFTRPQPRRQQYPIGWNLPTPPGFEGTRLASFDELRRIARRSSFVRSCIEKLIDEIIGLETDIIPTKEAEGILKSDKAARDDWSDRRLKMLNWWKRPDPEYDTFRSWFRVCIEDLIVIDALSLYLVPTKLRGHGLMGGNLAQLMRVDGATIKPLLDMSGGRPQPPAVAYQQFIYGVPRVDLQDVVTRADIDDAGPEDEQYRADQMLYLPSRRNPESSQYGYSLVESVLIPAKIEIQKQMMVLASYDDGNIPPGFLSLGNVELPSQGQQWQDALDAKAGDLAARSQITVVPKDSKYIETHSNVWNDAYDFANKEEILMNFGLSATDMGLLPGGKGGGLSGKGTAEHNTEQKVKTAIRPMLGFFKASLFDLITQQYAGQGDMQFVWPALMEDRSLEDLALWSRDIVPFGLGTVDEGRDRAGMPRINSRLTSRPWVMTTNGPVLLVTDEEADAASVATQNDTDALDDIQSQDDGVGATKAAKLKELGSLRSFLRKGKALEKFNARHLSAEDLAAVRDRGASAVAKDLRAS